MLCHFSAFVFAVKFAANAYWQTQKRDNLHKAPIKLAFLRLTVR